MKLTSDDIGAIMRFVINEPGNSWAAVSGTCREWRRIWRAELLATARYGRHGLVSPIVAKLPSAESILKYPGAVASFISATTACSCSGAAQGALAGPCFCGGQGESHADYLAGAISGPYPPVPGWLFSKLLGSRRIDRDWMTQLVRDQPQLALIAWCWHESAGPAVKPGITYYGSAPCALTQRGSDALGQNDARPQPHYDQCPNINILMSAGHAAPGSQFRAGWTPLRAELFAGPTVETMTIVDFDNNLFINYPNFMALSAGEKRLQIYNRMVTPTESRQICGAFMALAAICDGRAECDAKEQCLTDGFITLITNAAMMKGQAEILAILNIVRWMDDIGGFGRANIVGRYRPELEHGPSPWATSLVPGTKYYNYEFVWGYDPYIPPDPAAVRTKFDDIVSGRLPELEDVMFLFTRCIEFVRRLRHNAISTAEQKMMKSAIDQIVCKILE